MTFRKKLVMILIIAALAGIVLFYLQHSATNDQAQKNSPNNSTSVATNIVQLTNSSQILAYTTTSSDLNSMQSSLYQSVKLNIQSDLQSMYLGTVRDWSIRIGSQNTTTITTFLVDIPTAKQSYKVEIDNDSSNQLRSIYVRCPSQNELVYGDFNCRALEQ